MAGPQHYLKKPPTFKAMQWKPGTPEAEELEKWLFRMDYCIQRDRERLLIINKPNPLLTLEVWANDWIVLTGGEHHELVIIPDGQFQREYVLSDEQEPF